MRDDILELPVDILSREETASRIEGWLREPAKKPKMVVTAYSEFFVAARRDKAFADIIKKADLVTPDGISVLAAARYNSRVRSRISPPEADQPVAEDDRSQIGRMVEGLREGLKVGGEILAGKVGESVTGVWLFSELTKMAEKKGWKVFLLGGWGGVSARTARMLLKRFPDLRVMSDAGESVVGADKAVDDMVVKKINAFKPDLLFVQYRPVVQEKWIASHLDVLKAGVAMGVGGTFNEYLGDFPAAPTWMERMGLKWLWRMIVEPKRVGRIFRAVVVFPWLVFRHSLRS